jgi:UDP-N-acetylmuramoyl-L-alanyl-D-glutamate--2,6-diaminopimelate ligase
MTAFSSTDSARSLKSILPEGDFISRRDIEFRRCQSSAVSCFPGDLFVAGLDGLEVDCAAVEEAIERGISGIVTEQYLPFTVPQCIVEDARTAFGEICHATAGQPAQSMLTIGVMGTHGKTTAALLVASVLKQVTGSVAYRTSLGVSDSNTSDYELTESPNAKELTDWLQASRNAGAVATVIELTDEMVLSKSISGLTFDVLLIPSLRQSQRHSKLRSEGLEASILKACEQLNEHGLVVYCADDSRLNRFVEANELPSISYGIDADAEVQGRRLQQRRSQNKLMITAGQSLMPLDSRLEGDHNARHLLGAVATGYAFGLELHEVVAGAERLSKIPGRLESVQFGQDNRILIDDATQPDRLAMALHAMARHDGGPVTVVAEIPNATTAEQRIAFGRVLERAATQVILTNTRHSAEEGQRQMWEVVDGCEYPARVKLIPNREAAIQYAVDHLPADGQLLLAGLGANVWPTKHGFEHDGEVAQRLFRDRADSPKRRTSAAAEPAGLRLFRSELD